MTEYKAGDRVEVVKPELSFGDYNVGDTFTVRHVDRDGDLQVNELPENFLFPREVRLISTTPAPSLITIDRADLPEVVEDMGVLKCDGTYYSVERIWYYRENAAKYLALAEFSEARKKAAQEAEEAKKLGEQEAEEAKKLGEQVMQKRRDEMADFYLGHGYDHAKHGVKRIIDLLIESQDAAKC